MNVNRFRAWNKKKKCYVDNICIYSAGELLQISGRDYGVVNKDDYVIEFYTEKRDKTERKICEGDIIRDEHEDMWVTVWVESEFSWGLDAITDTCDLLLSHLSGDFEIIGNKLINPKLLRQLT